MTDTWTPAPADMIRRDRALADLLTFAGREAGLPAWSSFHAVEAPTGTAFVARLTTEHLAMLTLDVWEDLTYGRAVDVRVFENVRWEQDDLPLPLTTHHADNLADAMSWLVDTRTDLS